MKNLTKKILAAGMATMLLMGGTMTAYAGQWKQQATGYHQMGYVYENSDGTYAKNGWHWIDGKCYYFNENGIMLSNTTTPDGCTVDASGAWVVNGVVQTQAVETVAEIPYDPVHPLSNVVDKWNLRINDNTTNTVCSRNVQAMLTNQMDKYFAPPVGEYVDASGNKIYTTQQDYDDARTTEQALYTWFCNWLNGMDFQHMSELDRAKEIQKMLAGCQYDKTDYTNNGSDYRDRSSYISVLINNKGVCAEFASSATALAKSLGLYSAVYGTGDHAVYYIWVDGKVYFGSNQELNLNSPTKDVVVPQ